MVLKVLVVRVKEGKTTVPFFSSAGSPAI